jgi:gliding motility-associated-like protein
VDHITVTVTKERSFYAPSAFSPDGDGVNDRFMLFAGPDVRQIRSLQIFDRWGNLVYRTGAFLPNDLSVGWDGSLDGQLLNPAVFVFYAEIEYIDGWIEKKQGDVALVR